MKIYFLGQKNGGLHFKANAKDFEHDEVFAQDQPRSSIALYFINVMKSRYLIPLDANVEIEWID